MENKKFDRKKWGIVVMLLFIIGIGAWCAIHQLVKQKSEDMAVISALQSTMRSTVNKYGQQVNKRRTIELSYKDLQSIHANDSSELGRLKSIIKKNTLAALQFSTITTVTVTGKPEIIRLPDDPCNPVYKDTIADEWSKHVVSVGPDTAGGPPVTHVECEVKNEYDFTDNVEKLGHWPFRKRILETTGTNKNPHTKSTNMISYRRPEPDHKKQNVIVTTIFTALGFGLGVFLVSH